MQIELRLAEIREMAHVTQTELAKAMGIKQPSVSTVEKPGQDMRLSTFKKYVEAVGGKVRIDVEMPDGKHIGFPI